MPPTISPGHDNSDKTSREKNSFKGWGKIQIFLYNVPGPEDPPPPIGNGAMMVKRKICVTSKSIRQSFVLAS